MNWSEITIYTSSQGIEPIIGLLMDLNINSYIVEDPKEIKLFIEQNSEQWDLVDEEITALCESEPNIKIYFGDNKQSADTINGLKQRIRLLRESDTEDFFGNLRIEMANVKDEDWANNWKQYFKPFPVGKKLVVKPTWEQYENTDNKIILQIDPGNSFGSGLHETTQLCLMALENNIKDDDILFDIGCGSGILSVAGALLGCQKVIGVDIDQTAVDTAAECVKTNNVEDIVLIKQGDLLENIDVKADIVIGNLFANIIKRLIPDVKSVLKKDGLFITSGIITDTLEEVKEAYQQQGFDIQSVESLGDWHLVIGINK